MKPSPYQINAFCQVARHGSFSRAAQAVGVTQSSLTQHVSKLEKLMDAKLFIRHAEGLEMTFAGRDLFALSDRFTTLEEAVVQKVASYRRLEGGQLTIMAILAPLAAKQGFEPDSLVCSDDGIEGRPAPFGMYQNMIDLGVYPASSVVKIDDTTAGIAEGVAAGCRTIGITLSGNYVGRSQTELAGMKKDEKEALRRTSEEKRKAAGADICIDTIADIPAIIAEMCRS